MIKDYETMKTKRLETMFRVIKHTKLLPLEYCVSLPSSVLNKSFIFPGPTSMLLFLFSCGEYRVDMTALDPDVEFKKKHYKVSKAVCIT